MPDLYTDQTEEEIRRRFIQKCDDLITASRATTYKEICDSIQISAASFNQVKNMGGMPTVKMLYNLQTVYKVPAESILFNVPPGKEFELIKEQLKFIQAAVEQIESMVPVNNFNNYSKVSLPKYMAESLKVYWQLYYKMYSTEKILKGNNLLRDYEKEIIDGPIADLGCGQSSFLLDFIKTNREIYAIDNEPFQLNLLKNRVLESNTTLPENWHFLELDLNEQDFPDNVYSLIICSNLFHFFHISRSKVLGQSIANKTTKGSLIYLQVHSTKHPSYTEGKKSGFSHFFTLADIDNIFNKAEFERIYTADIQRINTKESIEFVNLWLDKWYELEGLTDVEEIKKKKENYLIKNNLHAHYTVILRRK